MSSAEFDDKPVESLEEFERLGLTALQGEDVLTDMPAYSVYRGNDEIVGHKFSRGFTDFQHHMRMVFPEMRPLDTVIEGQVERARKAGSDVVIIDLGGGIGNFTRQPLVHAGVLPKTRKKLSGQTVDTHVKFYSVTDALNAQEHLRLTPFDEADLAGNEQFEAREVNYSVTSSQTLKKLLEKLGENGVDLIAASSFMQYLRPQVFEKLVVDIIEVLKPGGQFMAFGYANLAGRYLSVDDGHAEMDPEVTFTLPIIGETVAGDQLRGWAYSLWSDEKTTDEEFKAAISILFDSMFSSEHWQHSTLAGSLNKVKTSYRIRMEKGESPKELFAYLFAETLPSVEDNLRMYEMREVKNRIIDDLAQRSSATAVIEHRMVRHGDQEFEALVIKKRIDSKRKK